MSAPNSYQEMAKASACGRRTTLAARVGRSGVGIHTGRRGSVRILPADAGYGVRFLCGAAEIPAHANYVVSTVRSTCLGTPSGRVDTVEHLLSALYGMGVDDAAIEVEGPEIPILDGSARPWVEALTEAGVRCHGERSDPLQLRAAVALQDGGSWLVATPSDRFTITCVTSFDHPLLGTQAETFDMGLAEYASQIAPARTFGFWDEIEKLRADGLALGGSLDNALVIRENDYSSPLRVPNECLRHKALDLWGDLSLVGGRLHAAITAVKPGHRINTAFAKLLAEAAAR